MSQVGQETRSTIILFIAILIAVIITVWIILSFDKPNYQNTGERQTGFMLNGQGYNIVLQSEDNFS